MSTNPLRLRELREAAGLSQGTLAEAVDSTQRTISYLESESRQRVDLDLLIRIAKHFGVSMDELISTGQTKRRKDR